MAKHWSSAVYILCWNDMKSGGRRRMSWHKDRDKLAQMAAEMPEGAEPALYNGFGSRLSLAITPKEEKAKKAKKPKTPAATGADAPTAA